MRKRSIAAALAVLLAAALCVSVHAAGEAPEGAQSVLYEYDALLAMRAQLAEGAVAEGEGANLRWRAVSDDAEQELLRRAALPDDTLRERYCYTQEQIQLLRQYGGEPLASVPEMREAMAVLSASGEIAACGAERMGMLYRWTWSVMPVFTGDDMVTVTWEPVFDGNGNNQAAIDSRASGLVLQYYGSPSGIRQVTAPLTVNSPYRIAEAGFPLREEAGEGFRWARAGELRIDTDRARTAADAPVFEEIAFHFAYGHQDAEDAVSVSIPWGPLSPFRALLMRPVSYPAGFGWLAGETVGQSRPARVLKQGNRYIQFQPAERISGWIHISGRLRADGQWMP